MRKARLLRKNLIIEKYNTIILNPLEIDKTLSLDSSGNWKSMILSFSTQTLVNSTVVYSFEFITFNNSDELTITKE